MAEEKTYVFGESANNGILGLLGPMLSQRGVDPNVLLAMQGRNNDGFGEGGWFIWVIFLFFLMGWGGNGFGNNGAGGLGNQLNNDYGREMLLQAINGNGNAISQLATTLNCDINAVQSAINSVQSQIQSVGNQVGMSGQQIINAIQAGNCQIASQIASCCCDVRTAIERQGYEGQLATLNQTNTLGSKIDQQTTLISDKFCQLEMRELQNKIDALREDKSALINQLSQEHQTNAIQAFQAQTIAPVNAALQDLSARLGAIECKQPATVSWSELVKAENLLRSNQYNIGITYSNFKHKCSIVVIGLTTSAEEFQNTFDHEKGHLAMHISLALKIKPYGEEYQYLTGEIGQSMFKIAKRFLCDDCRQKLVIEIKEIDKKD